MNSSMSPPENPFDIRDCLVGEPLRPWKYSAHRDRYVEVDNAEGAFGQFREALKEPHAVRDDGRLVVVAGETGTGKSALIHRCADWLERHLARHTIPVGVIVDLTRSARLGVDMAVRDLETYQLFVQILKDKRVLTTHEGLPERPDNMTTAYRAIGSALKTNMVLIVLLPKTELVEEIVEYAARVRPRMVFLMEYDDVDALTESVRRKIDRAGDVNALHLAVHALVDEDGNTFVKERLAQCPSKWPSVNEAAMRRAVTGPKQVSIRLLQQVMRTLYANIGRSGPREDPVQFEEITETFWNMRGREEE